MCFYIYLDLDPKVLIGCIIPLDPPPHGCPQAPASCPRQPCPGGSLCCLFFESLPRSFLVPALSKSISPSSLFILVALLPPRPRSQPLSQTDPLTRPQVPTPEQFTATASAASRRRGSRVPGPSLRRLATSHPAAGGRRLIPAHPCRPSGPRSESDGSGPEKEGHGHPPCPSHLLLFSPPLPWVPQKPLVFQSRAKCFGRVVETGWLGLKKKKRREVPVYWESDAVSRDVPEPGSWRRISRCPFFWGGWLVHNTKNKK